MKSQIGICLDELSASPDADTRILALTVLEYLETRDPDLVSRIPVGGSRIAGKPAELAATTEVFHPDGMAVLELVALLIRDDRYHDAMVNSPNYSGYGRVAFGYQVPGENAANPAQTALIEAASRVGVPNEKILRYVMLEHGYNFNFGWTRADEDRPLGWGADPRLFDKKVPEALTKETPFEQLVWRLPDKDLAELMISEKPSKTGNGSSRVPSALIGTVARFRPECLSLWMEKADADELGRSSDWQFLLRATAHFDDWYIENAVRKDIRDRFVMLMIFSGLRDGRCSDQARLAALELGDELTADVLLFLSDYFPVDLAARATTAILANSIQSLPHLLPHFTYQKIFRAAASVWAQGGDEVYQAVLSVPYKVISAYYPEGKPSLYSFALHGLLTTENPPSENIIVEWTRAAVGRIASTEVERKELNGLQQAFWTEAASSGQRILRQELMNLLSDKLKTLRQLAISGLATMPDSEMISQALEFVRQGKLDQKLGAAELLCKIGDATCLVPLEDVLASEHNEKVRAVIHEALNELRGKSGMTAEPAPQEVPLADLESSIAKQASKLKLPASPWLKREALPALRAKDGTALSPDAVGFLIAKQAKHKSIEAAPDILPLLAHIDHAKSAPLAAALVEGFLNSDQAAADRWALTLGGLLGDKRIIPPLLSQVQDWCENSRHKLAEYAAQAISLLPGNEPLMVLDTLSNRYRSKFKNVGKACAEAFNAAAAARGITTDELGDLVVPDFGFDSDGIRRFDWDGGGASAELGENFKLTWFDPETDKAWKALPANAPQEIKNEVKTLTKLLREAVKGQTARLEMTLVRQRRWPVSRWRELFENHPLLRSFASSLVWGVYDSAGKLLRTFRRYPNGLLADAAGTLEELPESDTVIGMVHPLELDAAEIDAWRAHLTRFKVEAPFPQIDRPVELLDPLHGNRRSITLTEKKTVSAGTFRSGAEKRGWARGSVYDGGGISSYYKLNPGAGIEVVLPTENFWIGCDPMETVELRAAYFATAESIQRGSYVYNEPGPDDPRVLRFDAVPAVVWSETISDLKAIVATKE